MMDVFFKALDKYLGLIVTVAIIAVLVSRRSTTSSVIQTFASAMSNILGSIVAPITNGTAASAATSTPNPAPTHPGTNAPNGSITPPGNSQSWMDTRPDVFSW